VTHPITPPPELVQQLYGMPQMYAIEEAFRAGAQWGADRELDACCEWLMTNRQVLAASALGAARRPKPPSLKEQALDALGPEPLPETGPTGDTILNRGSIERHRTIRRALEALPND